MKNERIDISITLAISEVYNMRMTDKLFNLVKTIIECLVSDYDPQNWGQYLWKSINSSIIYYDDQWEIMKYYQNPDKADFQNALKLFYDDLSKVVARLQEE